MIFYSSAIILVGVLLVILGIHYIVKPKSFIATYNDKDYKNFNLYLTLNAITNLTLGISLITVGIISFIIDHDFIFSIVFACILALYLLLTFIIRKNFYIKKTKKIKS